MRGRVFGLAALAAVSILLLYGPTLEAVQLAAFAAILVVIADIDQATRRIPNALVLTAFSMRVLYIVVLWFNDAGEALALLVESLVGAIVIGGGLLVFTMVVDYLRGSENMGGGDIMLQKSSGGTFESQPKTFPLGPAIAASAIAAMLVLCPPVQALIMF